MNGNSLGRDKIFNSDIWTAIDKAVKTEVGQVRVAQKVFTGTPTTAASVVPTDQIEPDNKTLTIVEGQTTPLLEISVEFSLTESQVEAEPTLRTGRTLAQFAAKSVAMGEDFLLFQGKNAALDPMIRVVNKESVGDGLLGLAAEAINVDRTDQNYPQLIFQKVADGIGRLVSKGQPGPYALLLETSVFADTHAPLPGTLVLPADRISSLVPSGFYGSGALLIPAKAAKDNQPAQPALRTGLLASLGGEPTTLYITTWKLAGGDSVDAVTAFTQSDTEGRSRFRVFERMQLVCRDPDSLVRFNFIK